MNSTKKALFSILGYALSGLGAMGLALYLSSFWLSPAKSQEGTGAPPTTNEGNATPDAEMPRPEGEGGEMAVEGDGQMTNQDDLGTVLQSYLPENFMTPYSYDPDNRRDPFSPPTKKADVATTGTNAITDPSLLTELQRFELEEMKVVGIMWDVAKPKALLEDPNGTIHRVYLNTKVGQRNGYVAVIREGELVVVEPFTKDGVTTYVTRSLIME